MTDIAANMPRIWRNSEFYLATKPLCCRGKIKSEQSCPNKSGRVVASKADFYSASQFALVSDLAMAFPGRDRSQDKALRKRNLSGLRSKG
jgi:hypothetical protein